MSVRNGQEVHQGAEEVGMKALGFIPKSMDYKDVMVKVYSEEIAAFYDPRTKTMHLIKEPAAKNQKAPSFFEKLLGKKAGFDKVPGDTAGFLELCKALKKNNTPAGFPLGHATGDGNTWAHWALWSHGGNLTDASEKVVIDSPDLAGAYADYDRAKAGLALARKSLDRQRGLAKIGGAA